MEKNCYTCKWRNGEICNCKDVLNSITTENVCSSSYSEDGFLSIALEENLKYEHVFDLFFDKLIEENFIKKSFLHKKLNGEIQEEIMAELRGLIDYALSSSIENYFGTGAEKTFIENFEFSCKHWE